MKTKQIFFAAVALIVVIVAARVALNRNDKQDENKTPPLELSSISKKFTVPGYDFVLTIPESWSAEKPDYDGPIVKLSAPDKKHHITVSALRGKENSLYKQYPTLGALYTAMRPYSEAFTARYFDLPIPKTPSFQFPFFSEIMEVSPASDWWGEVGHAIYVIETDAVGAGTRTEMFVVPAKAADGTMEYLRIDYDGSQTTKHIIIKGADKPFSDINIIPSNCC